MFIRVKGKGIYRYLQVVENHREGTRVAQRVLCTLGRMDHLMENGTTDSLLRSLARFGRQVKLRMTTSKDGWKLEQSSN